MKSLRILCLGMLLAAIGSLALADNSRLPPAPAPVSSESSPIKSLAAPHRKTPAPLKEADLIASLIAALKDEDAAVRENVSEALQALGDKAVPALIESLKDKSKVLRITAATLLGKMPAAKQNKAALPALVKLLKDKEVEVRRAASLAIVQIVTPAGTTNGSYTPAAAGSAPH